MHMLGLYQAVESVSRRQIKPSCASISYKYLKTNAGDFGEYELWDVDSLKLGHLECLVDIFIYRSHENLNSRSKRVEWLFFIKYAEILLRYYIVPVYNRLWLIRSSKYYFWVLCIFLYNFGLFFSVFPCFLGFFFLSFQIIFRNYFYLSVISYL